MDEKPSDDTPLIPKENEKLKDPLLLQKVNLNTDIYALTWTSLRSDVWEDLSDFRGHRIFLTAGNLTWLKINFIMFITLVLVTVILLLYEVFTHDLYKIATWPILFLRLTLVTFSQKKLEPEFYQGIVMLRYTIKNQENFLDLGFALFVSIFQVLVATLTFFCIIIFVCMADEALDLVMNFAALAVISELDDWIGQLVTSDKPFGDEEEFHKSELYNLHNINERMRLTDKMSLVSGEVELIDDQNYVTSRRCFIIFISYLIKYFPWYFLPLLVIPINDLLLRIQPHHPSVAEHLKS